MIYFRQACFFLVLAIGLVACEQALPVDDLDIDRNVVVESIYSDHDSLLVRLVYSRSIFDSSQDFRPVHKAAVSIECLASGVVHDMLEIQSGIYLLAGEAVQPGFAYELRVNTVAGEHVSAKSYIPAPVVVQVNGIVPVEDNGEEGLQIDFDIIDDEDSNNYYVWDIITDDKQTAPGGLTQQLGQWIRNRDTDTEGPIRFNTGNHWKIFSDDSAVSGNVLSTSVVAFDGTDSSSSSDQTGTGQISQIDSATIALPTIHLRVQAVSRELYQYYQSIDQYYQYGAANTSFSDPALIYSNVQGGHGIFAGFTETIIQVQ